MKFVKRFDFTKTAFQVWIFNLYIHIFIFVFDIYGLSISSVPGTVLGAGDMVVNKTDTGPVLMLLEGETLNKGSEGFEEGEAMGALCV